MEETPNTPAPTQPVAQTPDTTPLSQTQLPQAQPQQPAATTGRTVLCIEDEHFIGELYARALGKAGYIVTVVSDGKQGLKAAQAGHYSIILLDLMVPSLTGIEILRILRDPEQTPNFSSKIIITTNLEQREDVRADIEKQADGYVVKAELTPRELAAFINTVK